jgi:sugar phosphate isomerase/epimerase
LTYALSMAAPNRRFSLCYLTVNGVSLAESISIAAETGYESVGLRLLNRTPAEAVFRDEQALREAEQRFKDTGVTALDTEIFWLLPETNVRDYQALWDAMERLDSRLLLVLSRDPDLTRVLDNFSELCRRTAPHGIKPCLEFCKVTTVETIDQAVDIARQSGEPNARVLVDALHLSRSGGTPADVARTDPAWFEYAQLCDAPAAIPDRERMFKEPGDRLLPGDGGLPLVDLIRALPADLPIGIEAPVKALEHLPPEERATRALAGMRRVLEAAAVPV